MNCRLPIPEPGRFAQGAWVGGVFVAAQSPSSPAGLHCAALARILKGQDFDLHPERVVAA